MCVPSDDDPSRAAPAHFPEHRLQLPRRRAKPYAKGRLVRWGGRAVRELHLEKLGGNH